MKEHRVTADYSGGRSPMHGPALNVGPRALFGRVGSEPQPDERFRNSSRVLRVKGTVIGKRHGTSKVAAKR